MSYSEEETKKYLEQHGKTWDDFVDWMTGQSVDYKDGKYYYHEYDVEGFCSGNHHLLNGGYI